MKLYFYLFLSLILAAPCAQAREVKDATGTLVKLPDHPVRIVTLAPSVGELAAEFLEVDLDRIVGVSESTDYPPALKKIESVGPYQRFNLERVIALKPDLVLATLQGNSKDQVLHLRELGAPVFVMNTATFSDVEEAMREAAQILGDGARGAAVADRFEKSLAEIRARGAGRSSKPLHVLIQLDEQPLVVAGGPSFLSEALNIVGATNVYEDAKTGYPRPSIEDVLRRNPEFVLVIAFGPDLKPFNRMAYHWGQYSSLAAKKSNQIKVVFADTLLRPSMRLLEGLAVLERTLYGQK